MKLVHLKLNLSIENENLYKKNENKTKCWSLHHTGSKLDPYFLVVDKNKYQMGALYLDMFPYNTGQIKFIYGNIF